MSSMHFFITIQAPREKVWNTMLEQETYRNWTAEFTEGSYFDGSWEQRKKFLFLDPAGSGMPSVISEDKPRLFVSIKHLGVVKAGIEDTESPEIKSWSSVYENCTFDERDGITELKVDLSAIPAEFEQYMTDTWPKALARLKSLCE